MIHYPMNSPSSILTTGKILSIKVIKGITMADVMYRLRFHLPFSLERHDLDKNAPQERKNIHKNEISDQS